MSGLIRAEPPDHALPGVRVQSRNLKFPVLLSSSFLAVAVTAAAQDVEPSPAPVASPAPAAAPTPAPAPSPVPPRTTPSLGQEFDANLLESLPMSNGVWSIFDDQRFTDRLERQGFAVQVRKVEGSRKGRGRFHIIWLARRN